MTSNPIKDIAKTFGSTVSDRRRRLRYRLQDFLTQIQPDGTLSVATWNEIEWDRKDPAELPPMIVHAISRELQIDEAGLRKLMATHPEACREENRKWNLLVEEAHASRHTRRISSC